MVRSLKAGHTAATMPIVMVDWLHNHGIEGTNCADRDASAEAVKDRSFVYHRVDRADD